ncbi:MAG: hypothetical protein SCJ93_14035 [Bacillota bacterium]|nr:hypothetical protein [Bacillota bacterium]
MSSQDFNNGFITGLAMKGIPFGVAQSWQPESITNDDTESINIDFGRHIPEVEIESYIDALYFTATYIQDQYLIEILGWERINDTTIKFLTTNYFSCNGVVNIMYNTKQGDLDALPSFVVNYYPDGVPMILYRKFGVNYEISLISSVGLSYNMSHQINNSLITPILNPLSETFPEDLSILTTGLDYGIIEGTIQTTFE